MLHCLTAELIDGALAESSTFSLKISPRIGRWKSDWGQLRGESVFSPRPAIAASSGLGQGTLWYLRRTVWVSLVVQADGRTVRKRALKQRPWSMLLVADL